MIIGTAGHIDHGKTSLVRALTGVDTDRLPAEKARGITIELGFAPITLGDVQASVVDVPGHEAFVRTMVAGAVGIDVALLVVAADDGVRPQTQEHLAILRLLGVQRGVVAITKCDRVDAARVAVVTAEVQQLIASVHADLASAPMVPVSVVTGEGVETLRNTLRSVSDIVRRRGDDALVRLPIDRVLSVTGTGTVVTGTLWSGEIRVSDALQLGLGATPVRVRAVQRHGVAVEVGRAGERLAIALSGVDRSDVERGDLLVGGDGWRPTTVLRANVELLPQVTDDLTARTRVRVHLGTREVGARIVARGGVRASSGLVPARVVLDAPVIARAGDRLVIRRASPAGTIGGGIVTDAAPDAGRVRPFQNPDASPAARQRELLTEAKWRGVDRTTITVRIGEVESAPDEVFEVDDRWYDRTLVHDAAARLSTWLAEWHRSAPTAPGAPLAMVPEVLRLSEALTRAVVTEAADVIVAGPTVRLASFTPRRDAARDAATAALERDLDEAGLAMPSVKELTLRHGTGTEALLRALRADGAAVLIGQDRWTTPAVVQQAAQRLVAHAIPLRDYTASEIREMFGISRKYLIPWLEYFDREGITLRHGDLRRLGARAQRVADGVS